MERPRILLADDNAEIRQRVEDLLRPDFDVVGAVTDGQQALDSAIRLKPDVLVTDISMSFLDGMELAECLRDSACESKVIFLTVHEDNDYVEAALALNAYGYVLKSRINDDLVTAIGAALEGQRFVSPFPTSPS